LPRNPGDHLPVRHVADIAQPLFSNAVADLAFTIGNTSG